MRPQIAAALFLFFLTLPSFAFAAAPVNSNPLNSQATLTLSQSDLTIKVGDKAAVNVTLVVARVTQPSQVCFSVEGLPGGFLATFEPQCPSFQASAAEAVLSVEVTPAAAPQEFTALVIGRFDGETAQANLHVTAVPGISPWIPWSLVLAFVAFFVVTLLWTPRRSKKRSSRN